jgi:hypothetical protein
VQIHDWRTTYLHSPHLSEIALDYSSLATDEQQTLSMMIFRPVTSGDAVWIKLPVRQKAKEVP